MITELRKRKEFKKGALYGRWLNRDLYVVYSYGVHWPLACWSPSTRWSLNTTPNSRTTNRHAAAVKSSLHGADVTEMGATELGHLISELSRPESLAPDHKARKQCEMFEVSV